jgi:hypothetical protein
MILTDEQVLVARQCIANLRRILLEVRKVHSRQGYARMAEPVLLEVLGLGARTTGIGLARRRLFCGLEEVFRMEHVGRSYWLDESPTTPLFGKMVEGHISEWAKYPALQRPSAIGKRWLTYRY